MQEELRAIEQGTWAPPAPPSPSEQQQQQLLQLFTPGGLPSAGRAQRQGRGHEPAEQLMDDLLSALGGGGGGGGGGSATAAAAARAAAARARAERQQRSSAAASAAAMEALARYHGWQQQQSAWDGGARHVDGGAARAEHAAGGAAPAAASGEVSSWVTSELHALLGDQQPEQQHAAAERGPEGEGLAAAPAGLAAAEAHDAEEAAPKPKTMEPVSPHSASRLTRTCERGALAASTFNLHLRRSSRTLAARGARGRERASAGRAAGHARGAPGAVAGRGAGRGARERRGPAGCRRG